MAVTDSDLNSAPSKTKNHRKNLFLQNVVRRPVVRYLRLVSLTTLLRMVSSLAYLLEADLDILELDVLKKNI